MEGQRVLDEIKGCLEVGIPTAINGTVMVTELAKALPGEGQREELRRLVAEMCCFYKKMLSGKDHALARAWLNQVSFEMRTRGLASKKWIKHKVGSVPKSLLASTPASVPNRTSAVGHLGSINDPSLSLASKATSEHDASPVIESRPKDSGRGLAGTGPSPAVLYPIPVISDSWGTNAQTVEPRSKKSKVVMCEICRIDKYMFLNKQHAFESHIPTVFQRVVNDRRGVLDLRQQALEMASRWITGQDNLEVLCKHVDSLANPHFVLGTVDVSDLTLPTMQAFCKHMGKTCPERFSLRPANSVGVLLHWKVLFLLVNALQKSQREAWMDQFDEESSLECLKKFTLELSPLPTAFDSYYQLYPCLKAWLRSPSGTIEDLRPLIPVQKDKEVQLVGSVAVFSDPGLYPSEETISRFPNSSFIAVGMDPKKVVTLNPKSRARAINTVKKLIRLPSVVALGEIGLDHSSRLGLWQDQVEILYAILPALEPRHVLVLRLHGLDEGDRHFLYMSMLHHLQLNNVPRKQYIHLHCFTGTRAIMTEWLNQQPNTFFGFTRLALSYGERQKEALKAIPDSRLLLESDAPHYPPAYECMSTPFKLYDTAEVIASLRGVDVKHVLKVTTENGLKLYAGCKVKPFS